jgi:hypothetical protein
VLPALCGVMPLLINGEVGGARGLDGTAVRQSS